MYCLCPWGLTDVLKAFPSSWKNLKFETWNLLQLWIQLSTHHEGLWFDLRLLMSGSKGWARHWTLHLAAEVCECVFMCESVNERQKVWGVKVEKRYVRIAIFTLSSWVFALADTLLRFHSSVRPVRMCVISGMCPCAHYFLLLFYCWYCDNSREGNSCHYKLQTFLCAVWYVLLPHMSKTLERKVGCWLLSLSYGDLCNYVSLCLSQCNEVCYRRELLTHCCTLSSWVGWPFLYAAFESLLWFYLYIYLRQLPSCLCKQIFFFQLHLGS